MPVSHFIDQNSNSCLDCLSRKDSLFNDLSDNELEILDKNRFSVFYNPGEIICKEGSKPLGLICLNKGKVKMVRRRLNGSEQIVGLKQSVDFINFRALLTETVCSSSSIALEECSVCIVKKKDFFKIIKSNNSLALKIIRVLAESLINQDNYFVNISQKSIRARLAEALLLINTIFGKNPSDGFLNVSLKRSELAGLANMSTNNAIRVLNSFKLDRIVEVSNRKIRIIDMEVLKKISAFNG